MKRLIDDFLAGGSSRAWFAPSAAPPVVPEAALLDAVAARNQALGHPAGAALVDRLRSGAGLVVTGQQVGLFGGPLLTLAKAVEAIRLADRLGAVPAFWMAAQDHDLAELYDVDLLGKDGRLRLEAPAPQRRSVGALPIGEQPGRAWIAAGGEDSIFGTTTFAPTRSYTEAFAAVLVAALGQRTILLLDPLEPTLARALGRQFLTTLDRQDALDAALAAREAEIVAAGFELQVEHRREQMHWFFLQDGERVALDRRLGGLEPRGGTPRALAEWRQTAEATPEAFQPAVLARPAAVAAILPQLAAVLGPAEIAYWAQALARFPALGVAAPTIQPRPQVVITSPRSRRLLQKFGLRCDDVLAGRGREQLGASDLGAIRGELEAVRRSLAGLERSLIALDPSLASAVGRTYPKIEQLLGGLETKAREAAARRDETKLAQFEKLMDDLCPGGTAHERRDAVASWLVRLPDLAERFLASFASAKPGGWNEIEWEGEIHGL